jgi:hypothetical protein
MIIAMYKFLKKPYTLAGFEPGIFFSVGGRDDHNTTPPGLQSVTYILHSFINKLLTKLL